MKVLLDSGSSKTLINLRVLPAAAKPRQLANNKELSTIAGTFLCSSMTKICELKLPGFNKGHTILDHNVLVSNIHNDLL